MQSWQGSKWRRKSKEKEEFWRTNKKLLKISQFFRSENFIVEESNEHWGENEEIDVTKSGTIAENDNSKSFINSAFQEKDTAIIQVLDEAFGVPIC